MKTNYFFILVLSLCMSFSLKSQFITTVVGTGSPGYSGDFGPANMAQCAYVNSGVFDAVGNMYIIDDAYLVVRKVDTSGIITLFAGNGTVGNTGDGGPATSASFEYPIAIAVDATGNVYIVDTNADVVRKVNTAGIISTVVGTGVAGYNGDGMPAFLAQLNSPNGIAFDAVGNMYVTDGSGNRIRKVTPGGIISTIGGTGMNNNSGDGGQATAAEISNPFAIAVDSIGNIYVSTHTMLRKIDTSGVINTVLGSTIIGYSGDGGQAVNATSGNIYGICIDVDNNIYVSDNNYNRVRKINTAGIVYSIAGIGPAGYNGDGIPATYAGLNKPMGIFLDMAGDLYIADWYNFRVRKVTNVVPGADQAGVISISNIAVCNDTVVSPVVTIENFGTDTLTYCVIRYGVYPVGFNPTYTHTWTGSLTTGQTEQLSLPSFQLPEGSFKFYAYSKEANSSPDVVWIGTNFDFSTAQFDTLPILESFETATIPSGFLPNENWDTYSPLFDQVFQLSADAAATGAISCKLDNFATTPGGKYYLQTLAYYDMTSISSAALSFKAAYQKKQSTNADKLQVYTSTTCGNSWVLRKTITATTLSSLAGGTGTSPYYPSPSQFTTYTVSLSSVSSSSNVMFRWEFVADPNGVGNNLYIDDINLNGIPVGIESHFSNDSQLKMYPNPAVNVVTIQSSTELGIIQIYNVLGQQVAEYTSKNMKMELDLGKLNSGIYFVKTKDNYQKLIRE